MVQIESPDQVLSVETASERLGPLDWLYEFLNFHTPKSGPELNEIFIFSQTSLRAMDEGSLYGRELSMSFQMQPSDPPKIW